MTPRKTKAAKTAPPCRRCGFRRAEAHVVAVAGRFKLVEAADSALCGACAGRGIADEPVDESDVVAETAT